MLLGPDVNAGFVQNLQRESIHQPLMSLLNCYLICQIHQHGAKKKNKETEWPILYCPSSLGQTDSPNIITRQLAWWQSRSHWNHVRLFKGRRLFQETGSHCQRFGLSSKTCDWFANHQRARHNHASPQWTRTLLRLAGYRPTAPPHTCMSTYTYKHKHKHTDTHTLNVPNTFLPVWITCWTISHGH